MIGVIFEVRDCRGPSMLSTAPCPRLQDAAHAVGCLRDIMKCVTSHREMRLRLRFIGYSRLAQLIKRHSASRLLEHPNNGRDLLMPCAEEKSGVAPVRLRAEHVKVRARNATARCCVTTSVRCAIEPLSVDPLLRRCLDSSSTLTEDITKAAIRRLARRGGVEHIARQI